MRNLLPYSYKIPGYSLLIAGTVMTYLYFVVNIRLEIPVPAIISSFTETKFFTTYKTNFADELTILFLISGFSLIVFSKEKNESGQLRELRISSLNKTIVTDICILLFATLFIYGSGYMAIIIMNLFLPFIIYLIYFNVEKRKLIKT
ncbi:MAG: hypothetical protein RBT38_09400 [Bacteroidales bacterium]|jgi:hypothetical protein|nr:hypothetical protein [Bacteroidales bacterium]